MMARPAASTPAVIGDICRRPSRRRVVRTAQWWVARNCRASARSIICDLLSVVLRRCIALYRIWGRHRGTARGGEIRGELLGERPGGLVLCPDTVSGSLSLGSQVRFVNSEHLPMFEHDAAIYQNRVNIGARFGVDEGVERMIEGPQKHGIGPQKHEIGFIA